jgi:uncharacterized membrane-anchored protein
MKSDADAAEKYASLKGNVAKTNFRQVWCQGQYDKYMVTKSYKETHQVENRNAGAMFPLQRIAVEEGGGESGVRAAINYALKALEQTEPGWVEYNTWTRRANFKYVVKKSDKPLSPGVCHGAAVVAHQGPR